MLSRRNFIIAAIAAQPLPWVARFPKIDREETYNYKIISISKVIEGNTETSYIKTIIYFDMFENNLDSLIRIRAWNSIPILLTGRIRKDIAIDIGDAVNIGGTRFLREINIVVTDAIQDNQVR